MSLNPCEQRIYDYLQSHPEERQHWQGKFQSALKIFSDDPTLILRMEPELWRYYEERSAVAEPFRRVAQAEGLRRTSMKNLAELLLRLWTEPRAKKAQAAASPEEA